MFTEQVRNGMAGWQSLDMNSMIDIFPLKRFYECNKNAVIGKLAAPEPASQYLLLAYIDGRWYISSLMCNL